MSEWYQQSPSSAALKGSALLGTESSVAWLNIAHARDRLEARSEGASLATLTQERSRLSGMLVMDGSGGGSAERKTRKRGCVAASSPSSSTCRSKLGSLRGPG
jgi:hypothetical protein